MATSTQVALNEVHNIPPHPCDRPGGCKHKGPQRQQPRNNGNSRPELGVPRDDGGCCAPCSPGEGASETLVFVSLELDMRAPQATQNAPSQTGK